MQEDSLEMKGLPGSERAGKSDAQVMTTSRSATKSGGKSDEFTEQDSDSAEYILPVQGKGIMKTVSVSVT
jgi:hypothetical protein